MFNRNDLHSLLALQRHSSLREKQLALGIFQAKYIPNLVMFCIFETNLGTAQCNDKFKMRITFARFEQVQAHADVFLLM